MLSTQEILEKLSFLRYHTSGERTAGPTRPARERYLLNPVLHWEDVQAFEKANGLRLPEEIWEFVTALGNGGAGPFSGLGKFGSGARYTRPSMPFDLSHFVRVQQYDAQQMERKRKADALSVVRSGGEYNPFIHPNGYQQDIKKRWGIDLADDEYVEYGSLAGCLPIGRYRGGIVYLLIDATPQYAGSILLGPDPDNENKSAVHYQWTGVFGAFYLNWLDKQIREFVCMDYFHQFKESLFVKPSEGKRAYATRVVFPGPAAALAATPFFINEKGVGCWLSTEDPEILVQGKVMRSERYALHLPSIDQHGKPLSNAVIKGFLHEARRIGLDQRNRATGYWTLSTTGALQQEAIWILYAATEVPADRLRQLARRVLEEGDQDAVAMEVKGWVDVLSRND